MQKKHLIYTLATLFLAIAAIYLFQKERYIITLKDKKEAISSEWYFQARKVGPLNDSYILVETRKIYYPLLEMNSDIEYIEKYSIATAKEAT